MSWCYLISCKVESYPRDMEDGWGKEFHSKASMCVSIQYGYSGPVAYKRVLDSEASHPNRLHALELCFRNFSEPGINCWVASEINNRIKGAPGPGTKLPVLIDPYLPEDFRDFLSDLLRKKGNRIEA